MAEVESYPFCRSHTHLNREQIVITCGSVILEMALQDRKAGALLLQNRKGLTDMPEEFASCPLQQIKIARVVDVVSNRAIGIAHPVITAKDVLRHADQCNSGTGILDP